MKCVCAKMMRTVGIDEAGLEVLELLLDLFDDALDLRISVLSRDRLSLWRSRCAKTSAAGSLQTRIKSRTDKPMLESSCAKPVNSDAGL